MSCSPAAPRRARRSCSSTPASRAPARCSTSIAIWARRRRGRARGAGGDRRPGRRARATFVCPRTIASARAGVGDGVARPRSRRRSSTSIGGVHHRIAALAGTPLVERVAGAELAALENQLVTAKGDRVSELRAEAVDRGACWTTSFLVLESDADFARRHRPPGARRRARRLDGLERHHRSTAPTLIAAPRSGPDRGCARRRRRAPARRGRSALIYSATDVVRHAGGRPRRHRSRRIPDASIAAPTPARRRTGSTTTAVGSRTPIMTADRIVSSSR